MADAITPLFKDSDPVYDPQAASFGGVMAAASAARAGGYPDIADAFRYFANSQVGTEVLGSTLPALYLATHRSFAAQCFSADLAKAGLPPHPIASRAHVQALFLCAYAVFTSPGELSYPDLEKIRELIDLARRLEQAEDGPEP